MPEKEIFDRNKHNGLRFWNIEELFKNKDTGKVKKLIEEKSLILDLDLDYFNENENDLLRSNLMHEQKIIDNLTVLRDLYPWDLITVALSPIYCGGEENALYLLELFCRVFNVNPADALYW